MTVKFKNTNGELDLTDPETIKAIREAEVVNTVSNGAPGTSLRAAADKPHKFETSFSHEQVARLARLHPAGDWESALNEHIDSLINDKIGRSTINGPSQYSSKVTGPSNHARFV